MTRQEFVTRLLDLGRRHGDIPIYGGDQWDTLDDLDPRRFAAVVRAAEAWYAEGTNEATRARMLRELEAADRLAERLCVLRLRQLSYDLSEATDWTARAAAWKPAEEWARLHEYDAPPPRQGQPWTADDLDRDNWAESAPPIVWWMFGPPDAQAARREFTAKARPAKAVA